MTTNPNPQSDEVFLAASRLLAYLAEDELSAPRNDRVLANRPALAFLVAQLRAAVSGKEES